MNTGIGSPAIVADNHADTIAKRAHYSPPWADLSIIGIAGSSGSGKSTLSHAIVSKLNLPWVVILSMVSPMRDGRETGRGCGFLPYYSQDSYYKPLDPEASRRAFLNEYDFDSPDVRFLVQIFHRSSVNVQSIGNRFRCLSANPTGPKSRVRSIRQWHILANNLG